MAIYRQIQTTFWGDSFITTLTPEQKYFYIYLLTNDNTKQCGIYEITPRKMSFDTGYNQETIEKLLAIFEKHKKIKWSKTTNEIALINWPKYNNHGSPKVQSCIKKELTSVKNKTLIPYIYGIGTISQQEEEQKETQEQPEEETLDFGLPQKSKKEPSFFEKSIDLIKAMNLSIKAEEDLLIEWVNYKHHVHKEHYKTEAFTTKYLKDIKEFGFVAVKEAMYLSIASEYKGYFPKHDKSHTKTNSIQPEPNKAPKVTKIQDYD